MQILYFAGLRTQIGTGSETLSLPAGIATLDALRCWLMTRSPAHAAALGETVRLRAAVNQDFATPETPVTDRDEVAFFPPVTGG